MRFDKHPEAPRLSAFRSNSLLGERTASWAWSPEQLSPPHLYWTGAANVCQHT